MKTGDKEMDDFKEEIRKDLGLMTEGINGLTESIRIMVTENAVNANRRETQNSLNESIIERLTLTERNHTDLLIQRAKEEQSRNFIYRYWPVLFVIILASSGGISALVSTT